MRVRFAVLVVLAALCAVVVAQPEYGPACNIVNDCADVADDFPYCIDVNDDVDEEELRCVECYSDINCPAGYFCAKSDYPEIDGYDAARRWQCVEYGFPIGELCDPDVDVGDVEVGANDKMMCAFVTKYDEDEEPEDIQWEGACVNKQCYECVVSYGVVNNDNTVGVENRVCASRSYWGSGGSYRTYTKRSNRLLYQNTVAQMEFAILFFMIVNFVLVCCLAFENKLPIHDGAKGNKQPKKPKNKNKNKNKEKEKPVEDETKMDSVVSKPADDVKEAPAPPPADDDEPPAYL